MPDPVAGTKGLAAGRILSLTVVAITGVVGVSSFGDDLSSYEIGVVDVEENGVSLTGSDKDPGLGRPATARDALNLDALERILGGGRVLVWNGRDPLPRADELVDGWDDSGLSWCLGVGTCSPLVPALYNSPFRMRSSMSCRPGVSSSLALSASPTRCPSESSLPVRMDRWMVRVDETGTTLGPREFEVSDMYEEASLFALKCDMPGFEETSWGAY